MKDYVDYKCRCPQCAYSYIIRTYEPPSADWCPLCGHWGDFNEFLLAPHETTPQVVRQAEDILASAK